MYITDALSVDDDEITLSAIRAQGPGGQNAVSYTHLTLPTKA